MTLELRKMRTPTEDEHAKSEHLSRARAAAVRRVTRARSIELAATGLSAPAIATQLTLSETCVRRWLRRWLRRFEEQGLAGLDDAPRAGRPRTYDEAAYAQVLAKARSTPPSQPRARCPRRGTGRGIACRLRWPSRGWRSSAATSGGSSRRNTSSGKRRGAGGTATTRTARPTGGDRCALDGPAAGQHGRDPRRTRPGRGQDLSRPELERRRPSPPLLSRLCSPRLALGVGGPAPPQRPGLAPDGRPPRHRRLAARPRWPANRRAGG
jgi:Homeodomain-like domain